jgi:hypothetical protein
MKKSLLILFAIIFAISLNTQAEDFSAVYNGKTIYYNITSSTSPLTVAVTYRGPSDSYYPNEYSGTVSIPDSVQYSGNYYKVTSIGDYAFRNCIGLTSVTIPNSVTSIGDYAFTSYYTSLTSITIPNSVISIGDQAFYGCTGLTSITIPNSVTSIGYGAFYGCSGLTSITIPNSVTSIGSSAFYNCYGLTSITIGNSVTSIGDWVFYGCIGLTSVTIPNSVTSIGGEAFKHCTSLTSITIPNSVISIGSSAFYNCSGLTSITIPNSVTSISDYAFNGCTSLTSITIGNSVTSIGQNAFRGCSGLTSITIPNSVTSIGNNAFQYCTNLDTVYFNANNCYSMGTSTYYVFDGCFNFRTLIIGDSVQNIPSYAFYNCNSLTSITSKAINPPAVQGNSFSGVSKTIPFNLPCISIQSYQSNSYWNEFTNKIGGSPRAAQFITTSICPGETYTDYGANINTAGDYTLVNGCDSVILNLSIKPTFQTDYYDTICKGQNYNNYGFSFVADTSGIYKYNLQAVNSCDSVICLNLFVNPIYNDTIIAEICNGETYSQFGFNENTAGFYTQSLQTIKGCDSIVNLNLIINPIYNDTILAEICSNETYTLNGFNVYTAGFYTQNLQTTKGCDSVVNLNLIVNPIYLTNHFDTICKGQLYNNYGFNFTSDTSGFYTQNLQTIKGCDSIINLNLIVNPIYNDTIIAEICNGETYSQFGFNENTAGFYTQSLQTIKGCDSVVNLSLIVNPIYNDTIIAEICQGEVYSQFGFIVSTAGFYTQSLQTIKGCDSIVNLSLIVNPIYNDTIIAEICQGETYSQYGFNVNSSGLHTQSLQAINGCDSVVNLSLVVNPTPNKPLSLVINQTPNYFELIWQGNSSEYDIYRNDSLIANVSQPIYLDNNLLNGTPYCYKVKARIGDCESEFSDLACKSFVGLEDISQSNLQVKLYPNPTEGKARLEIEGLNSDADVLVYDMVGRVVQRHSLNKGKNDLEIDLSGYAKGVYSVRIVNESVNQTLKLIVQ